MSLGHPALRLLARRKFLGVLRKQVRRLKTPTGALFAIVGLAAIVLWVGSIAANAFFGDLRSARAPVTPETARLVGTAITVMSLIGSLSFRGLYLPREEIELLFAAPLSRGDVIRYRLWTALGKSLFGSMFFGLVVMGRVSVPLFGFLGAFVAMMTVPIVAQIASLFAGDAENRWIQRLPKGALRAFNIIGVMLILAIVILPGHDSDPLGGPSSLPEMLAKLLAHPIVRAVTLPVWPWATLVTSSSAAQFFPLFGLCLAVWWMLFEACARVRIDYRELSLETSADVAKRLSRMRRGGAGASAGKADKSSAGWRVPWLFGRGAFGALAWRKSGTILRKARGTLLISGALVLALVAASWVMFKGNTEHGALASSVMIACAGTLYLCAGLRFDFREDLERMDVVRSWPVAPSRVFLAAILPEALLVGGLLALAIVARMLLARQFPSEVVIVLAALGPAVLNWIAIDNAVFLLWPQRLTPGSDGLLQQAGRSLMLMLVRGLVVGVVGGAVFASGAIVFFSLSWAGTSEPLPWIVAVVAGLTVLYAQSILLVMLGGKALARFDVARDR